MVEHQLDLNRSGNYTMTVPSLNSTWKQLIKDDIFFIAQLEDKEMNFIFSAFQKAYYNTSLSRYLKLFQVFKRLIPRSLVLASISLSAEILWLDLPTCQSDLIIYSDWLGWNLSQHTLDHCPIQVKIRYCQSSSKSCRS